MNNLLQPYLFESVQKVLWNYSHQQEGSYHITSGMLFQRKESVKEKLSPKTEVELTALLIEQKVRASRCYPHIWPVFAGIHFV